MRIWVVETYSTRRMIDASVENISGVRTADMDGDGDWDVLATILFRMIRSAWYENLGNSVFSPGRAISAGLNGAYDLGAADMDGDGDLDLLSFDVAGFQRPVQIVKGCLARESGFGIIFATAGFGDAQSDRRNLDRRF